MSRPAVAETRLFSYLVTRQTGRAVRQRIERQIADSERLVLNVLDLGEVPLIDFSCADEVVAKLMCPLPEASSPVGQLAPRRYVYLRRVGPHHVEPIAGTLSRQGLAVAAELENGEPALLGAVEEDMARAWRALWDLGRADARLMQSALRLGRSAATAVLQELEVRHLVIRQGDRYVAFAEAVREASRDRL